MGGFSSPFYDWKLDNSQTISYFNTISIVLIIIYSKVLYKDIIQQALFLETVKLKGKTIDICIQLSPQWPNIQPTDWL